MSSPKLRLVKRDLEGKNYSIFPKLDKKPFAQPCKTIHLPKHPKSKCKLNEGKDFCLFCLLDLSPVPKTVPVHSKI